MPWVLRKLRRDWTGSRDCWQVKRKRISQPVARTPPLAFKKPLAGILPFLYSVPVGKKNRFDQCADYVTHNNKDFFHAGAVPGRDIKKVWGRDSFGLGVTAEKQNNKVRGFRLGQQVIQKTVFTAVQNKKHISFFAFFRQLLPENVFIIRFFLRSFNL